MKAGDEITLDINGKLAAVTIISQEDDGTFHGSISEKELITFKLSNVKPPPPKRPFLQSFFRVGPKKTKQAEWLGSLGT